jgi:molecular chaperone IbpA
MMKDLNITAQRDNLIVSGKADEKDDDEVTYLHHGIAARAFQRTFRLADHIKVTGAEMRGLLTIDLVHEVPEDAKPRMIPINGNGLAASVEANGKKQKAN